MLEQETHKQAYLYAIRLLTRRDYSYYKLKQKLISKDFQADLSDKVLTQLQAEKLFKEENYIGARVRGLMHKNLSPYYIQQKLAEERISISQNEILDIFAENTADQPRQIKNLIEKKIDHYLKRESDKYKVKFKLMKFLMSKGHSPDKTSKLISLYLEI